MPRDATGRLQRTGKQGVCKELKGNIFTISTSNKAKVGDTLRKTTDALALYIGFHYGEEAAKEFANGKQQANLLPVLEALITARHAVKVLAYTTCVSAKIAALEGQVTAINTAMTASPNDLDLLGRKIDTS